MEEQYWKNKMENTAGQDADQDIEVDYIDSTLSPVRSELTDETAVASTADEPEGKVLLVSPDHDDVLSSAEALLAHVRPVPKQETDEVDLHAEIWRYAKIHGIGYKQAMKRMFDDRPKSKRPRKPKPVRHGK